TSSCASMDDMRPRKSNWEPRIRRFAAASRRATSAGEVKAPKVGTVTQQVRGMTAYTERMRLAKKFAGQDLWRGYAFPDGARLRVARRLLVFRITGRFRRSTMRGSARYTMR